MIKNRQKDRMTPRDCGSSKCSNNTPANSTPTNRKIRATHETAYNEAYKSLTPEEQRGINSKNFRDAGQLLHNLSNANDKSLRDSRTRKGMKKLQPKLEAIQQVASFTGIVGAAEPTGSLAIVSQLVSATCSVGIQLAGVADTLDTEINRLFDLAPRLIQCDEISLSTKEPDLLRKDLVKVYTGMFKFYLVAMKIFQYHGPFGFAIKKYRDEITQAVSEFSSFWNHFLEGVQIDTLETTTETLDMSRKIQIAEILEKDYRHELNYRPPKPAAGTCQWLFSTHGPFKFWNQPPTPATHFLTMFGAMGSGKTVATAYLADHIASDSKDRTVLRYYIHNDSERSEPTNIYCSLIRQFLSWHPKLEVYLWQLLQECTATDPQRQSRRPEVLRQCFVGLLDAGPKQVCIFLDALDALDPEAREELGYFFQDLRKLMCQCKVFLTSQPNGCVKKLVPGETFEIDRLRKDIGDENYRIAKHLMDAKFFEDGRRHQYSKEEQQRLIKEISVLADGSPMMVYLNVAHADALTRGALYRTVDKVLQVIENAPSGHSKIPQKWTEIRKQVLEHLDVDREMVDPLLRFLAITSRPVTIREACAFIVYDTQDGDKPPQELNIQEQKNIIQTIRPFVVTDDESDPESVLRLYHNSLQKLILLKEPSTWDTADDIKDDKNLIHRKAKMNGAMASKCIRYLQFPDCSKKDFIQSGQPQAAFFNYAACAWPHHMANSAGGPLTAEQVDGIVAICKPGSGILLNWTDQNYLHTKAFLPDDPAVLDALVIAVHFRLDALTAMILDRPDAFAPPHFQPQSASHALTCLLQTSRFSLANHLVAKLGSRLRTLAVWTHVMRLYSPAPDFWLPKPSLTNLDLKGLTKPEAASKQAAHEQTRKAALAALTQREHAWQAFLDPFVRHLLPVLGADALCEAVACGCLAVVKQLFARASRDTALRRKLLEPRGHRDGQDQQHQVIGVAAQQGDVEMLRFLLRQGPGMEKLVRHLGPGGETVFHAAAQMVCSDFRPEVFVELKRAWPGGVDVLDGRARHWRDLLRAGESELVP
ncbi:hypothetical protein DIS24_g11696 [Lasiodiplodia hormozganensis]|uniref:Nephrocystin 3-like N-terminal domain-containing protein n=1 Tax=Lasiodiplodia hormozganensis TaxID=869390 RepID=A0AA39WIP4_9PEZI|nr:hypothetical protein DIS24_g11696 [Lasiodiplodia hormozganensis]